MIPVSPPGNFTFPALIPARRSFPPAPGFKLLPEGPISHALPETPPIPATVQPGDLITAAHENTVTEALSDLWTDVQALDSGKVPATRQVIAGAGLSGGGALSADVTLTANVKTVFGRTGDVVLTAAEIGAAQTPWLQNVNGGGFTLSNAVLSAGMIGATQTPWLQNIDGANHSLSNVAAIGIGASAQYPLRVREGADMNVILNALGGLTTIQATNDATAAYVSLQYAASKHIFSSGPVGIGTASPVCALHIETGRVQIGPSLGGTTGVLDIYRNTGVENYIRIHYGNVHETVIGMTAAGAGTVYSSNDLSISTAAGMTLGTSNTVRLTIDAAGKITMGNNTTTAIEMSGRALISSANDAFALGVRYSGAHSPMYIGADTAGTLVISDGGGTARVTVTQGGVVIVPYLPSASPGAGTKALWYDPADGNRMKYAP